MELTQTLSKRLYQYALLMRLHRPIGILLLLWPTLLALWLAGHGQPNLLVLTVFILGTILMRSAGCVINDYADRRFDGRVERTKNRPLVTGNVSDREAMGLFAVLILFAFILVLLMNPLTIFLAVIGAFLAILYPFTKRFTHLPQVVLGLAFGWGVPMAYAAQTNTIPWSAWWLYAIAVIWPIAYDTMYAMTDRDDDVVIGIKSTAILFGKSDKLITGILQALVLLLFAGLGVILGLNYWYYFGLAIACALAIYQQYLIKDRNRQLCFKAFLNNNWFGFAVFAGVLLNYLYS